MHQLFFLRALNSVLTLVANIFLTLAEGRGLIGLLSRFTTLTLAAGGLAASLVASLVAFRGTLQEAENTVFRQLGQDFTRPSG